MSASQGINVMALMEKAKEAERFLKALANGHRLMILCELHKGESAVTPLQNKLALSQAPLSQHLAPAPRRTDEDASRIADDFLFAGERRRRARG